MKPQVHHDKAYVILRMKQKGLIICICVGWDRIDLRCDGMDPAVREPQAVVGLEDDLSQKILSLWSKSIW